MKLHYHNLYLILDLFFRLEYLIVNTCIVCLRVYKYDKIIKKTRNVSIGQWCPHFPKLYHKMSKLYCNCKNLQTKLQVNNLHTCWYIMFLSIFASHWSWKLQILNMLRETTHNIIEIIVNGQISPSALLNTLLLVLAQS